MESYTNPVYHKYMADPFVLHHEGSYYAYGTSPHAPAGWSFPILVSTDLVHWRREGYALRLPEGASEGWAPEVAFRDGVFYLYYSANGSNGQNHQLRVATSSTPTGPFEDSGRSLIPDDAFTIDAHPFKDRDGQWYLFYARDFLTRDGELEAGTGIVVDRLLDMFTVAGEPRVVVRPDTDWQLFQMQRPIYDGIYDWYTVEGPALRVHDGRYYCFYSGGAWEQANYGVSYVVADHPLGPYRRPNHLEGPLLKSVPDRVIGPGHNSFTNSPDGSQDYIVYHGWDPAMSARLMRIDRLEWQGAIPVIPGPTSTPQPVPAPSRIDHGKTEP